MLHWIKYDGKQKKKTKTGKKCTRPKILGRCFTVQALALNQCQCSDEKHCHTNSKASKFWIQFGITEQKKSVSLKNFIQKLAESQNCEKLPSQSHIILRHHWKYHAFDDGWSSSFSFQRVSWNATKQDRCRERIKNTWKISVAKVSLVLIISNFLIYALALQKKKKQKKNSLENQ